MAPAFRCSLLVMIVSLGFWLDARSAAAQPPRMNFDPREMQEQMFRREDRNGNGVLDSDELERMAGGFFFRETLAGRDLSRSMDFNEFSELTRQAMERARANGGRFGGGFGGSGRPPGSRDRERGGEDENRGNSGDNSGSRDGSSRSDDRRDGDQRYDRRGDGRMTDRSDSSSRSDGNSDSKSSSKKSEKPTGFAFGPVTYKLPDQYRSRDHDGDGQIGLYEWPRSDFATFRRLDRDGDGFLTPAELIKATGGALQNAAIPTNLFASAGAISADKSSSSSGDSTRSSTPGSAEPGASQDRSDKLSANLAQATPNPDESEELNRRALQTFDQLDRDKDGIISAEEWGRSRMIRPTFERANVGLYPPISRDQFVPLFVKVNPQMRNR